MSHTKLPRPLFVFLFVLPLLSALAQAQPSASLPDLQSVGALGTDLFLQSGSTGMVLVVVRDDQVFFRGYGETAPNSHQLPTQDSLLRLCSLTKIFTTDVLTKLVADKTVRLDDPLQRYAPRAHCCAQTRPSHHARRYGDTHIRPPAGTGQCPSRHAALHLSRLPHPLALAAKPASPQHSWYRRPLLECGVRFSQRCPSVRCTQAIRRTSCRAHSQPAPHATHDVLSQRRAMQTVCLISAHDERPLHRHRSHRRKLRPLLHRSRYDDLAQVPAPDGRPRPSRTGRRPLRRSLSVLRIWSDKRDSTMPANPLASVWAGSTSCQSTPPRTSSKRPAAEPASKPISPSTTLAVLPSSLPPPTAPSTPT